MNCNNRLMNYLKKLMCRHLASWVFLLRNKILTPRLHPRPVLGPEDLRTSHHWKQWPQIISAPGSYSTSTLIRLHPTLVILYTWHGLEVDQPSHLKSHRRTCSLAPSLTKGTWSGLMAPVTAIRSPSSWQVSRAGQVVHEKGGKGGEQTEVSALLQHAFKRK